MTAELDRYHRQMLLRGIGREGQHQLSDSTVLLLGCGALGCVAAETLARAGVGHLLIVDRDIVEITNLQRQVLFDEADAADGTPKAEAAKRRLTEINSDVQVTAIVDDINASNIERLIRNVDVMVDGLDNFETRYLANDVAVKHRLPYVYGAAVGTSGMSFTVLPRGDAECAWSSGREDSSTPCFRCLFEEAPPPGSEATCDTVGVLNSLIGIIANVQATETIKILTKNFASVSRTLLTVDVWSNQIAQLKVDNMDKRGQCRCCRQRQFEYLDGKIGSSAVSLCGRNAVQVRQRTATRDIDFADLETRLRTHGSVTRNAFVMRALINEFELTVFKDGRAIIKGTDEPAVARGVYAKYVGT